MNKKLAAILISILVIIAVVIGIAIGYLSTIGTYHKYSWLTWYEDQAIQQGGQQGEAVELTALFQQTNQCTALGGKMLWYQNASGTNISCFK